MHKLCVMACESSIEKHFTVDADHTLLNIGGVVLAVGNDGDPLNVEPGRGRVHDSVR